MQDSPLSDSSRGRRNSETTIRITPRGVFSSDSLGGLRELWRYRRIAVGLVQRNLRLRYKGSALGIVWSLFPPIVQVFVLAFILGYILNTGMKNQATNIFCAFVPWLFISSCLLDGSSAVLEQLAIMKKAYFPRELLPIATVLANLVHFAIALGVFLIYRYVVSPVFVHHWPGLPPREILWLPVVVADMVLVTTGLSLLLSAWTTFFEDIKYIVSTCMQLLFYGLPIMYPAEEIFSSPRMSVGTKSLLYHLYLFNPFAWIITVFKSMFFGVQEMGRSTDALGRVHVFYTAPFDYRFLVITTATSLLTFIFGYRFFQRLKWTFVEKP